jgi:hypothetical protein
MGAVTKPPFAEGPWRRGGPVPPLPDHHMEELLAAVGDPTNSVPSPWVLAGEFEEPGDAAVFGAVYAVQMLKDEPWLIRGVLRSGGLAGPALVRVTVEHFTEPAREVTGSVIRDINFGQIRDAALAYLGPRADFIKIMADAGVQLPYDSSRVQAIEKASAEATKAPSRSRRIRSVDDYRRLAVRYLELVAEGRRDVLKALADEEGVRRETVRGRLRKATELGMLGPGKQGRAGREPGPNLHRKEQDNG